MARCVTWTHVAGQDLESAAEYIARDSPRYASAFVREALSAARSLRSFAERGPIVSELGQPSIRQLLVGGYRLVYQVTEKDVAILGLIHGARDFPAVWEEEDR